MEVRVNTNEGRTMIDRHYEDWRAVETFLSAIAFAALCLDDPNFGKPSTRRFLNHIDSLVDERLRPPVDQEQAERLKLLRTLLAEGVAGTEAVEVRQDSPERDRERYRRIIDEEFGEGST